MIKRILHIVNLFFALLLFGVYAGAFIRPEAAPYLSLFNYIYPLLLFINAVFCILWLFWKPIYIIVPLAAILAGCDYIPRLIGTSSGERASENSLKIMTYNVENFSHEAQNTAELRQRNTDSIIEAVKKENPDILCFQEYSASKNGQHSIHRILTRELGYEYYFAPAESKYGINGSVIYSKEKIIRSGCPFPMKELYHSFAFADIKAGKEVLRIYNIHLASYQIIDEEKNEVGILTKGKIPNKEVSRSVKDKLIAANKKRSIETREMVELLQQTKPKCLVVGDFNSTPYSYTYREFSKLMKDSFRQAGKGFSGTYNGPLPAFRIDYVFCSEGIKATSYCVGKYLYSDHKPIIVDFETEKKK